MTTTTAAKAAATREGAATLRRAREAAVASGSRPTGPVRRRWGRVAAGVAVAVIGAWLSAALYLSAGNRVDVLAVTTSVARSETITRDDLQVVGVSVDSRVATVRADQLDAVVGRVASTDLVAGSLLSSAQLRRGGERPLGGNEAIVGLLLERGDAPLGQLRRGLAVLIVVRGEAGREGDPAEIPGRVFDASGSPLSSGEQPVEVVVTKVNAAAVSAAGAEKRVTVVALAE